MHFIMCHKENQIMWCCPCFSIEMLHSVKRMDFSHKQGSPLFPDDSAMTYLKQNCFTSFPWMTTSPSGRTSDSLGLRLILVGTCESGPPVVPSFLPGAQALGQTRVFPRGAPACSAFPLPRMTEHRDGHPCPELHIPLRKSFPKMCSSVC